jgi:putative ABC transport system substrate-binding protein
VTNRRGMICAAGSSFGRESAVSRRNGFPFNQSTSRPSAFPVWGIPVRRGCLNRRVLLVGVAVTLLFGGCAGRTPRVYRVGVLVGAAAMTAIVDDFKARMTELGYVEGKNIVYDVRESNGSPTEEKRIAGKFVADKVDLVFAFPGKPAGVVKFAAQGTKIPIVFANALIEGTDLVDTVLSPGGNITGVRFPNPDLTLKTLESLLELTPRAKRILVLHDPGYSTNPIVLAALRSAALSSNVTLQEVRVPSLPDTQAVLQGLEKSGNATMDAILLLADAIPQSSEAVSSVLKFADEHRVPVVGGAPTLVRNGAVLTATTDQREQGRLAAYLADRILKGTPAGTIPIMTTQPYLFINYKKAQELGLTVPQGLLKQATEIIH